MTHSINLPNRHWKDWIFLKNRNHQRVSAHNQPINKETVENTVRNKDNKLKKQIFLLLIVHSRGLVIRRHSIAVESPNRSLKVQSRTEQKWWCGGWESNPRRPYGHRMAYLREILSPAPSSEARAPPQNQSNLRRRLLGTIYIFSHLIYLQFTNN